MICELYLNFFLSMMKKINRYINAGGEKVIIWSMGVILSDLLPPSKLTSVEINEDYLDGNTTYKQFVKYSKKVIHCHAHIWQKGKGMWRESFMVEKVEDLS